MSEKRFGYDESGARDPWLGIVFIIVVLAIALIWLLPHW
jgi:hypothetical protein